jgi:zinc protease
LDAVITDFKTSEMRQLEENYARAEKMVMAFTNGMDWADYIPRWRKWKTLPGKRSLPLPMKTTVNNYAIVYKRTGEDPNKQRVEKPQITKVPSTGMKEALFTRKFPPWNLQNWNRYMWI